MSNESLHAPAQELVERLARTMEGLELAATDRNRLAAGCFRQAMEHHDAVIHLVRSNLTRSALALLRPLFEQYVHGLWLAKCASGADLQQFQHGTLDRPFAAMLAAVEFLEGNDAGPLAELRKNLSPAMREFLRDRNSRGVPGNAGDSIAGGRPAEETQATVALAGAIGLLAASEVALMAGRHDVVSALVGEAVLLQGVVPESR